MFFGTQYIYTDNLSLESAQFCISKIGRPCLSIISLWVGATRGPRSGAQRFEPCMYVRLINANNNDEVYSPHRQYGQYSYRQTNQQTDRYNYNKTDTIKTKLKEKINNNNNQDTSIKCQISSHFKVYRRGSEYDVIG